MVKNTKTVKTNLEKDLQKLKNFIKKKKNGKYVSSTELLKFNELNQKHLEGVSGLGGIPKDIMNLLFKIAIYKDKLGIQPSPVMNNI